MNGHQRPHPYGQLLQQLAEYDFEGVNEQQVREEWIAPLLSALGYGRGTINRIIYEQTLELAEPVRYLGSSRFEFDYLPTVLGVGLWMIEAKRPQEAEFWTGKHLGQAWGYATHPAINVPLMVLSDGQRLTVYDLTRADWFERPELELEHAQLPRHFGEVETVLGARNVARFVVRRQLGHLQRALEAQVDPDVVGEVASHVARLARAARPRIVENQRNVLVDEERKRERDWQRIIDRSGIFAIALAVNQPFPLTLRYAKSLADTVRAREHPVAQAAELEAFVDACRPGGLRDAPPRMFWMARIIRLAGVLQLVNEPGISEHALALADEAIRDHLGDFPHDPVARAAHRFELVLAPTIVRLLLTSSPVNYPAEAHRLRQLVDPERRLRERLEDSDLFMRHATLACRRVWAAIEPWNAETLDAMATALEKLLPTIDFDRRLWLGPAADPFFESWRETDPLKQATQVLLRRRSVACGKPG